MKTRGIMGVVIFGGLLFPTLAVFDCTDLGRAAGSAVTRSCLFRPTVRPQHVDDFKGEAQESFHRVEQF
jgi:hypothetical protein